MFDNSYLKKLVFEFCSCYLVIINAVNFDIIF